MQVFNPVFKRWCYLLRRKKAKGSSLDAGLFCHLLDESLMPSQSHFGNVQPHPPQIYEIIIQKLYFKFTQVSLVLYDKTKQKQWTNKSGRANTFSQHSTSLLCSALPQSISTQKTRHHLLPSSEEPSVLYSQQRSMLCAVLGHMAEVEVKHWSVCGLVSLDLSLKAVCVCSLPRSLIHTR